jgi:hypothetical protein
MTEFSWAEDDLQNNGTLRRWWLASHVNFWLVTESRNNGKLSKQVTTKGRNPNIEFYVHVTVHRNKFLYNKFNQMHQFPKFTPAWNYMFRAVLLPIIRNLFTVHSALVYVIQVCRQLSSRTRVELQICMTYTSVECTMNKLLMKGRRNARNM